MQYARIKEINADRITLDNGDSYRPEIGSSSKVMFWRSGDSVEIDGFGFQVTIRNTLRNDSIKASRV